MAKKIKRLKSKNLQIIPIESWSQADSRLRRLGDLQLKINELTQKAKEDIDEAKAELATAVNPLTEEIKLHTRELEKFAAANRKEFGRAQSRKLNFGLLGWRKSAAISIKKNTLELIKQIFGRNYRAYIHTKETVNKEALKQLTEKQLVSIDARRKSKEVFFVEPELPDAVDY